MKKFFVVILASLLAGPMVAQRSTEQPQRRGGGRVTNVKVAQKKHAFYLGLKAGLDMTTMSQPDECDLYDGVGTGFSGGLVGKVRFNQASNGAAAGTGLWGAGLELKYKNNTVKTIGTDETGKANADLSISYFEVPVYVQIYPFYKTDAMSNFYIEAGPDFAGTLSRSPESLTVEKQSTSLTYNLDKDGSKLKGMDVRIMAGVGYDFSIKSGDNNNAHLVGINARYYIGTSKLAGNFNSKMNTFEISLSWMFNIGNL